MSTAAGGVFVMKVNERSSKTVISTGRDAAVLLRGLRVERLAELHDVDAVLAQRGPTGGAGFACPPGIWSLMSVRIFFAIAFPVGRRKRRSVDLLHLVEAELDGDLALEDVDEHLQLLLVGVDVDDLAVEVGERAGGDLDGLAERELDLAFCACAPAGAPWWRMRSTSGCESGTGFAPAPTKPVTPGVPLTTVHASSVMSMFTRT